MSCCFFYQNPCFRPCCGRPYRPFPPPAPTPAPSPLPAPSVASFTQTGQAQTAADALLPIVTDFNSDPNNYSLIDNAVTLQRGYYIVSFSGNASAAGEEVGLALTLNGDVVTKSQATAYSDAAGGTNFASTFILYVPANGAQVGLTNVGAGTTQFENVNLVLRKINVV